MALSAGSKVGSYEVLSPLGAGGMGEVYRARDMRLNREVAIKVLPDRLTDNPERVARFEREAQALAALNHPHIAQVYAVEPMVGSDALVMELVDGETLADRLRRGPVPVGEALAFARQIADALDAAHERGIVHRDLKPANIKVTPEGRVKVLDFGLAKLTAGGAGAEPGDRTTLTGTEAGVVLGTVAYMSPEQARGQAVDRRTDVWAFGCVLYEMITGRAAFAGNTVSDTIAAVLTREPDLSSLPGDTPAGARRLLRRCLAKDPKQRLRDMGDLRINLEDLTAATEPPEAPPRMARRSYARWLLAAAVLLVAAGVIALLWGIQASRVVGPVHVSRTTITLPASQELDTLDSAAPVTISPDGLRVVYAARSGGPAQLFIRDLDAFAPKLLAGTEGARYPFFSPDGQSVAFFADGKLKRLSLRGGTPVPVCDVPTVGRGGTWSSDGSTIVFDPGGSGLMRVSAAGGAPEQVKSRDAKMDARNLSWPHFLPGDRALVVTAGVGVSAELYVLSLETGTWRVLARGSQAQYIPSGYLVYHASSILEGEIHAMRFDVAGLTLHGTPIPVLDGVFRSEEGGGAYVAVSPAGTLVFARGSYARTLGRVDRHGRRTSLVEQPRGFRLPRLSPDGQRVAVTIDPRPSQVWVYDLARGTGIPLSTEGHSLASSWTPDGLSVTYTSDGDMYLRRADASDEAQRLLERPGAQYPGPWFRDAQRFVFVDVHPKTRSDLWVWSRGAEPRPLVATAAQEFLPRLSPDERWLAYTSDESGRPEVYVRPFPDVSQSKWLVSTGGGMSPVWSPDGEALYYVNGSAMMSVDVTRRDGTFRATAPELLFTGPFETGSPWFDVFPDGTAFAMVEADPNARLTQIHLIQNWSEELARVAASR